MSSSVADYTSIRPVPEPAGAQILWRWLAVVVGALLTLWPALYNRYPLLYPDSMTYLADGTPVARAVFLHQLSDYYGMRSFIYSLGILPFHRNLTPWPVIALQAVLTAFVIWLVVRSFRPRRTVLPYLALMVLLSALSSVSWFVSLVLPDILGPLVYLCIYLLVYARDTLSLPERLAVSLIAWWGIASHATHLVVAAGLCVLLGALALAQRRPHRLWLTVQAAALVLLAAMAQLALHAYLYGEASLNGERPPFLMARVIADGPGRWYLEQHCGRTRLAICQYLGRLPDNADDFLWKPDSVWQSADTETATRLRAEEMPFVLATLRAYPRQQLTRSAENSWEQLHTIGLWDLDASDWVLEEFDSTLPGGRSSYLRGRQAHNALPFDLFSSIQAWTVVASLALIAAFVPWSWRRRPARPIGLAVIVVSTVIGNAFVTGAMSMVEERFEARIIWLLPLLAGTLLIAWQGRSSTGRLRMGATTIPGGERLI